MPHLSCGKSGGRWKIHWTKRSVTSRSEAPGRRLRTRNANPFTGTSPRCEVNITYASQRVGEGKTPFRLSRMRGAVLEHDSPAEVIFRAISNRPELSASRTNHGSLMRLYCSRHLCCWPLAVLCDQARRRMAHRRKRGSGSATRAPYPARFFSSPTLRPGSRQKMRLQRPFFLDFTLAV